jgi:hypothetical protein
MKTVDRSSHSAGGVRSVGGFFGLAVEDTTPVSNSVWAAWTGGAASVFSFGSGRAAIVAAIAAVHPTRIWLPAYLCREATEAVEAAAVRLKARVLSYPLTAALDPDMDLLESEVKKGDLVLVVAYFGWPPSQSFIEWTKTRPDVVWVEDRAQALWTADPCWTPWVVYSPRKLLGVPNGGILIAPGSHPAIEGAAGSPDLTIALPELMRFEDTDEVQNGLWYSAYQERERKFAQSDGGMSRLTASLLCRIAITPLVRARQANYDYLSERLSPLLAWSHSPERVAPFGVVIAVEDPATLARELAKARLFCPRHWHDIGANPDDFPYEHDLSRQLLTVPCDHRYSPGDLAGLADAIEHIAPHPGSVRRG